MKRVSADIDNDEIVLAGEGDDQTGGEHEHHHHHLSFDQSPLIIGAMSLPDKVTVANQRRYPFFPPY